MKTGERGLPQSPLPGDELALVETQVLRDLVRIERQGQLIAVPEVGELGAVEGAAQDGGRVGGDSLGLEVGRLQDGPIRQVHPLAGARIDHVKFGLIGQDQRLPGAPSPAARVVDRIARPLRAFPVLLVADVVGHTADAQELAGRGIPFRGKRSNSHLHAVRRRAPPKRGDLHRPGPGPAEEILAAHFVEAEVNIARAEECLLQREDEERFLPGPGNRAQHRVHPLHLAVESGANRGPA